jgi:hypothetical protein
MKTLQVVQITFTHDKEYIMLGEDKKIITGSQKIIDELNQIVTFDDLLTYLVDNKGSFIEEKPILEHDIDINIDFTKQFSKYVEEQRL